MQRHEEERREERLSERIQGACEDTSGAEEGKPVGIDAQYLRPDDQKVEGVLLLGGKSRKGELQWRWRWG